MTFEDADFNPDVNIAKGTTDPGVDCFDQKFWFGRFGLVGFVWFG